MLGEGHPYYATSLNDLAELYQAKGDYTQAEPLCRQALAIHKRVLGEGHPYYAASLDNLARLCGAKGDYAQAEPLYRQALAIRKRVLGEGHPYYAASLHNLALLYQNKGDYAQAEPLYRQALAIRKRLQEEDHPYYATSLNNLANLYQATNRPELALATLDHALKVQQTNLRRVFAVSAEPAMRAYLEMEMIHSTLDRLISMARTRAEPEPATTTLTWTLRRKAVILDTLCQFRDAQRRLQSDPAVAARVRRLQALRTQLNNWPLNPPRGLDAGALRQQLAAKRQEADQEQAELYRLLTASRSGQADDPNALDTEAVRRRLPAGSALVELVSARLFDFQATGHSPRWKPAHYFALVLRADRDVPPQMIDLGAAEEINADIRGLRGAVDQFGKALENKKRPDERAAEDHFRELGTTLFAKLFAPLRGAGTGNAPLPGPRRRAEPAAVRGVGRRARELLGRVATVRLPVQRSRSAPARRGAGPGDGGLRRPGLRPRRGGPPSRSPNPAGVLARRTRAWRAGALADELRGNRWESLKNFAAEATDIQRVLNGSGHGPVTVYQGPEALEERFKTMPAPRVLHVITHGFYLKGGGIPEERDPPGPVVPGFGMGRGLGRLRRTKDPLLRSGLVLAGANRLGEEEPGTTTVDDGWLTAGEIAALDLRGTELVVLSACESGLGDVRRGEGVYGLRRAFLYAGAQTLVTSLFPVPDEPTRELMGQFYRSLKEGRGKLSALHEAQLALIRQRRQSGGAAHPFFWASFVLVGDPD